MRRIKNETKKLISGYYWMCGQFEDSERKKHPIIKFGKSFMGVTFLAAIAAVDVLRERYGREYTEKLTGVKETGFKGFLNGLLAIRY